ncbi:MAG: hypothetical protein AW07_02821 [Candidatus Accumulibacter sp. SK-11]|nr:MAG: hypothetical protein AW07_02821 [Candidatus Accumulibacter sp. SK-11]
MQMPELLAEKTVAASRCASSVRCWLTMRQMSWLSSRAVSMSLSL